MQINADIKSKYIDTIHTYQWIQQNTKNMYMTYINNFLNWINGVVESVLKKMWKCQ